MQQIALGDQIVDYRIRRDGRARRLTLRVAGGEVVVSAPARTPVREIVAFVEGEGRWLRDALERARAEAAPALAIGDEIPFLDRWLVVETGAIRGARQIGDSLRVVGHTSIDGQVERWYRAAARDHFGELMADWAPRIGVHPARLAVRAQRSRWGSASVNRTISINWRLMTAPPEVAAYVMVHELVHLVHMNHSPAFWACVDTHWPNSRSERAWLRAHGARVLSGPHPRWRDSGDVRVVG